MKTRFSFISLVLLSMGICNNANAQSWDFTKGFSQETLTGLQRDSEIYGCWYPENDVRYRLQCESDTLCYWSGTESDGEQKIISETYGLVFTNSGYIGIDHGYDVPHLNLSNKAVTMSIPNMVASQRITIVTKTGNNTSPRGITCTSGNVIRIGGEENSLDIITHVFEVNEDVIGTAKVTFQPVGGGIHVYSIATMDLTDINVAIELLGKARQRVADCVIDLDTLGLGGLKNELLAEYEKTTSVDETSIEAINIEIARLGTIIADANQGKAIYYNLINLISECDSLVMIIPSEEFSTIIAQAQAAVDNMAITTVPEMLTMLTDLKSARNVYIVKGQDISSWNFNTTAYVDDYYLALDKTKKIARINRYLGTGIDVVIPETITYGGIEYIVVSIGGYNSDTWYNSSNTKLLSVELPRTLRMIDNYGFYRCQALEEIKIPQQVESLGEYAFSNCIKLKNIQLSDSLKTMGNNAFSGCSILENITIPTKVEVLSEYVFTNCHMLKNIQLSDSLKAIDYYAFNNCLMLENVVLPSKVTSIGRNAFYNCRSLKDIQMPDSLITIGDYAFRYCYALENLTIPAKVTSMGYNPFSDCNLLRTLNIEAVMPPVCTDNLSTTILTVYVPKGSGAAYRSANYWKNRIIIDGEGVNLTVNVATPGTLGQEILAQTEYLSDVNGLTISGTLNDDDIYNIKNRMPNLLSIDMSDVNMTFLPNELFNNRQALQKVVLPKGLINIGDNAFYQCYAIKEIELPSTLNSIGGSAFRECDELISINIPEGVTSIGSSVFYSCDNLRTVKLPSTLAAISSSAFYYCQKLSSVEFAEGLTTIGSSAFAYTNIVDVKCPSTLVAISDDAFQYCKMLYNVTFNEGLTSIGGNAFYECDSLREITLPGTLVECYYPFTYCDNLARVNCYATLPPYVSGYNPVRYVNMDGRELYVPALTLNQYKLTTGWDNFPIIKPLENYEPENIYVHSTLDVPEGMRPGNKPNVEICHSQYNTNYWNYGHLNVYGTDVFSIGNFNMVYDPNYEVDYGRSRNCYSTLVNEAVMRADSVSIDFWIYANRWTFISFPFDVKVSDIKVIETAGVTNWVIRKYSGEARANQEFDKTWQDMTADSILHAGEGYIMQCSRIDGANNNSYSFSGFTVSAINNTNKNLIFANDTRNIALNEYISEFSHNRSWNLVGNPFPCYYDTRAMEYTAPITVWNMSGYDQNGNYVGYGSYTAYSPVDDEYILRPGEAFFVQRPVDVDAIAFPTAGRQADRSVRERAAKAQARTAVAPRYVFNLNLDSEKGSDRTRFVINENATAGYDMNSDAAKFISSDAQAAQLFTIEGDVNYAINERPLGNGMIALGAYFGNEDAYTLSLNTKVDAEVILIDKVMDKEVSLNDGDYTFTAQAGTVTDRFLIKLGDVTSISNTATQTVTTVTADAGRILVNAPEVTDISLYTVEGKIVTAAQAASASFDVEPGFYVIKVHGTTYKVAVTR